MKALDIALIDERIKEFDDLENQRIEKRELLRQNVLKGLDEQKTFLEIQQKIQKSSEQL